VLVGQKRIVNQLIERWSADLSETLAVQVIHKDINPIAWILGHLTVTDNWLNQALQGASESRLSADFASEFAPGSRPRATGQGCPFPVILSTRKLVLSAQDRILEALTAADLAAPLEVPAPDLLPKVKRKVQALTAMSTHSAYHWGQIGVIRRGLGLPGFF